MLAKYRSALVVALALGTGACSTYLDQKADLMSGGAQQRVAQAQNQYNAALATNQNLEDQRLSMDRDVERNEKRIAAAQDELKKTNADLAAARAQKKVSEQQFSKLKAESDSLNRDLAKLDLQVQQDRGNNAASAEIAAKEARIKELERRKAELDRTIKLALGN